MTKVPGHYYWLDTCLRTYRLIRKHPELSYTILSQTDYVFDISLIRNSRMQISVKRSHRRSYKLRAVSRYGIRDFVFENAMSVPACIDELVVEFKRLEAERYIAMHKGGG